MRDSEKLVTKNDKNDTKGTCEATKVLNNETKEETGCTTMETKTKNTTIIEVSDQKVNISESCSYQRELGEEGTASMIRDTTNLHETSA